MAEFKELRDRCGGESYELRFNGYYLKPEHYSSMDRLVNADRGVAEDIARLEAAIKELKEYRKQLAGRAVELEAMPKHTRATLKREKGESVRFFLKIDIVYEDGTVQNKSQEVYPGKERRAALAAFEELVKAHPHWESVKDIEKGWWEK